MNAPNIAYRLYNLITRNRMLKTISDLDEAYRSGAQAETLPLLRHAASTVPFYQSLNIGDHRLESFPVVNKGIIKMAPARFLSSAYRRRSLLTGKTSGSNGVPLFFYWDKAKSLSRTAEVIYHNGWVGYEAGDLHLLNAVGLKKSKLTLFFQNEIVENPRYISNSWMAQQRRKLIDKKVPFYIGYGSVIDRFSKFCLAQGDGPGTFSLRGVISTAEHLSEQSRIRAENLFGCPVVRRYATLETGILAHECPEGRRYHTNNGNYHIELLKIDSDEPAAAGETARIVVTDVRSYAMPLIRYDIGDLAVVDDQPCSCGRKGTIIKELVGRTADNLINDQGQIVSWIAINNAMWAFLGIKRFQFVQHDLTQCDVNIVSTREYDKERLKEVVKSLLGESIEIRLNDVEAIESLSSGKTPYIVNKILPG